MRIAIITLGLGASLMSCRQEPVSEYLDYSSTKKIIVTFDYPDYIEGAHSIVTPSLEAFNALSLGRVFVNNTDVGAYSLNGSTEFTVPGNARVFQLRHNMITETRRASGEVDLSGFPAGSEIAITCELSWTNPDMVECLARPAARR